MWTEESTLNYAEIGDQCCSNAWLHNEAGQHFEKISKKVTYLSIIFVAFATILSLVSLSASIDELILEIGFLILTFCSLVLQIVEKNMGFKEKADQHFSVSKSFFSEFLHIKGELGLPPNKRIDYVTAFKLANNNYDHLVKESPHISETITTKFKQNHKYVINHKYVLPFARTLSQPKSISNIQIDITPTNIKEIDQSPQPLPQPLPQPITQSIPQSGSKSFYDEKRIRYEIDRFME